MGEECLTWPYGKFADGYARIFQDGTWRTVSRLVCEAHNGPAPTPDHEAAHSCGNGHLGCVNRWHLSWKTPQENSADTLIHGTRARGSKIGASSLTENDVRTIRSLKGFASNRKIGKMFGVTGMAIHYINTRQCWGWLK